MKKEFNLSEKIYLLSKGKENYPDADVIKRVDIREFIKRLKKAHKDSSCNHKACIGPFCYDWLAGLWINKLAGEKFA